MWRFGAAGRVENRCATEREKLGGPLSSTTHPDVDAWMVPVAVLLAHFGSQEILGETLPFGHAKVVVTWFAVKFSSLDGIPVYPPLLQF